MSTEIEDNYEKISECLFPVAKELEKLAPNYQHIKFVLNCLKTNRPDNFIYQTVYLMIRCELSLPRSLNDIFIKAAKELEIYEWMKSKFNSVEDFLIKSYESMKYRLPKKKKILFFCLINEKKYRSATKLLLQYKPGRFSVRGSLRFAAISVGLIESDAEKFEKKLLKLADSFKGISSDKTIDWFKENIFHNEAAIGILPLLEELADRNTILERSTYNSLKLVIYELHKDKNETEEMNSYMEHIRFKE